MCKNKKEYRIGIEKLNNEGYLMKVIEYNSANDIVVEFQDEWEKTKRTCWNSFIKGKVKNPHKNRNNLVNYNKQGCMMKIVEYIDANNIIVEFQDEWKYKLHTAWKCFKNGESRNPYHPSIYEVGIIGSKYQITDINGKLLKEYDTWKGMLCRCYDKKSKERHPTYKDVTCCDEWLLYENFYEWLHEQENFDKWVNLYLSALDKDILIKGNKIYSPETCFLVPENINSLFTKRQNHRGNCPIGVCYDKNKNKYGAQCNNHNGKIQHLGYYDTPEEAFQAYKVYKENLIKQIAQEEYDKGNITKKCYDAMMNYEVEITD